MEQDSTVQCIQHKNFLREETVNTFDQVYSGWKILLIMSYEYTVSEYVIV